MKTLCFLSCLLISTFTLQSQTVTPESILMKIPEIPDAITEDNIKESYLANLEELRNIVKEEIIKRKKANKENSKGVDMEAAKTMGAEQGFTMSEADMQKMKSKQMSKEEKMAMANKMMQQNYNMSVDEAKDVSKMSKQGQAAYGEAITAEKMAESQANQGREQSTQKKNMTRAELAQEQSDIAHRLQADKVRFEEKIAEYETLYENATKNYKSCCRRVKSEYDSKQNTTLGDTYREEEDRAFQNCYRGYCNNILPPYKNILSERLAKIKASANNYYRMEEINNLLSQSVTGTQKHSQNAGLMYLESLNEYLNYMSYFTGKYLKKITRMDLQKF